MISQLTSGGGGGALKMFHGVFHFSGFQWQLLQKLWPKKHPALEFWLRTTPCGAIFFQNLALKSYIFSNFDNANVNIFHF